MRSFRVAAVLAAMTAVATAAPAANYKSEFYAWKAQFGKSYAHADEEAYRYGIFQSAMAMIEAHNAKELPWKMGMNRFTDLTPAEFVTMYGGGGRIPKSVHITPAAPGLLSDDDLPSSVDWTSQGVVTPVKNQGQCGSCWTFSTTGAVESINAINGNDLVSLSEQQLVDCSTSAPNQGCDGGNVAEAFDYIVTYGGLCTEDSYPYTAQNGTCQSCTPVVDIASHTYVTQNSDMAMAGAVAKQPVSIAVNADPDAFMYYQSGVMNSACGTSTDHAVLTVGYGVDSDSSLPYWKIKNSWGSDWGESGYIRLWRDASVNGGQGQCGMYTYALFPSQ